jgi:mannose-6-phosphate isomerase-like protein (cupin superfamily)
MKIRRPVIPSARWAFGPPIDMKNPDTCHAERSEAFAFLHLETQIPRRSALSKISGLVCLVLSNGGSGMANAGGVPTGSEHGVEYFDAAMMQKAFTSGKPLINGSDGRNFKVMGLRRRGPGEVEVHDTDTDIFYVVQGHATFVTGGTLAGGRHTAPDESRGGTLTGGETRHLGQGDVIVIPKGVPHWFKEVPDSIEYFVVKVR